MSDTLTLDLAPWEAADLDASFLQCRDVDTDGEWVWGVAGNMIHFLVARRIGEDSRFNLCAALKRKPFQRATWLGASKQPLEELWRAAWEEGRVGHVFCLGDDLEPIAYPQRVVWKVFLNADGRGSWTRIASIPSNNNISDIVQNEAQSFRWHDGVAEEWLEEPAPEWLKAFQVLAREVGSDVAFAAEWAAKMREERDELSTGTCRDSFALFQQVLRLAVLTDTALWANAQAIGFQFQLAEGEAPGERAWLRNNSYDSVELTPRFERIWDAALSYFEPTRGGELARYSCVTQWLREYRLGMFHFWTPAPSAHERVEALLELRALWEERGLSAADLRD